MKLLTLDIVRALPPLYSTDNLPLKEKMVICKFFTPDSNWTCYVFEGEKMDEINDFYLFGIVHGFEKEMGYFLLSELEKARGPLGLSIERDKSVFKIPYKELIS